MFLSPAWNDCTVWEGGHAVVGVHVQSGLRGAHELVLFKHTKNVRFVTKKGSRALSAVAEHGYCRLQVFLYFHQPRKNEK